eukprot:6583596-Alexandrium_andersonii.AAC.1
MAIVEIKGETDKLYADKVESCQEPMKAAEEFVADLRKKIVNFDAKNVDSDCKVASSEAEGVMSAIEAHSEGLKTLVRRLKLCTN